MEKRKIMSVRDWVDLCAKEEHRAPGVREVGLHDRAENAAFRASRTRRTKKAGTPSLDCPDKDASMPVDVKPETSDDVMVVVHDEDGPSGAGGISSASHDNADDNTVVIKAEDFADKKRNTKVKRPPPTRQSREANAAEKHALDMAFLETFDPHTDWLPPGTVAEDYTPDFCRQLERQFWRKCGISSHAWYGADTQGQLTTYPHDMALTSC